MATTTAVPLEPNVVAFLRSPQKMLIDGEWVDAAFGKTFATYNAVKRFMLRRLPT
ncbi:MAG: hypothetical protein WA419_11900 [Silvibacterium sp.]